MNYKYEQYSSVDSWNFAELKDYETTTADDGSSASNNSSGNDNSTTNTGVVNPNATFSSSRDNPSTQLAQKLRSAAPDASIGSSLCIDRSCTSATRGSYNNVPVSLTGQTSVAGKFNSSNQTSDSGEQTTSAYSDYENSDRGYTW